MTRSRRSSRYLGTITPTQLDRAAARHLHVVPDDDYVAATALIVTDRGAARWPGVVDRQTGRFAYMAPTGSDQWQPTTVDPDDYTGLELADEASR